MYVGPVHPITYALSRVRQVTNIYSKILSLSAADMHVRQFSRKLQQALQLCLIPDEAHATIWFVFHVLS